MPTIGVHDWEDINVVVVKCFANDSIVGLVALDDLVCHVFDSLNQVSTLYNVQLLAMGPVYSYRSCDPLSSMHSAMPDDRRLLALSTRAPEVNTSDGSALDRVSCGKELGISGECRCKISEKLSVLIKGVV